MTAPAQTPTPEQVAQAHADAQAAIRAMALAYAMQAWASAPPTPADIFDWWFGGARDQIFTATALGQELMASEASDYVRDSLALQGIDADVPDVAPDAFAAVASDGQDLGTLLDQAVFRVWRASDDGDSDAEAFAAGEALLRRIVWTQTTDAGREADQVAIVGSEVRGFLEPDRVREYVPATPVQTTREEPPGGFDERIQDLRSERDRKRDDLAERKRRRPAPIGWIRMLTPPSCGRCAVLAGRWYGWNDGFQRHDNCDCRHIPALEADGKDMITDPREYFDSLTRAEQDDYFGQASAEAIRNGADISQVMNAQNRKGGSYTVDGRQYTREGTTRRGFYGRTEPGRKRVRRPTPLQIYRDSRGDREEAKRLLREFGYLVA